jgi:hypothetical protein
MIVVEIVLFPEIADFFTEIFEIIFAHIGVTVQRFDLDFQIRKKTMYIIEEHIFCVASQVQKLWYDGFRSVFLGQSEDCIQILDVVGQMRNYRHHQNSAGNFASD